MQHLDLDWHDAKEKPPKRLDLIVEVEGGYRVVLGDEQPPAGILRWAPVPRTLLIPLEN